jgi:hypothetical protein
MTPFNPLSSQRTADIELTHVQVDLMISHLGQPYAALHDTRPPASAYNQPGPDAQLAAQMQYIQRQQQANQQAQSQGHAVQGSGPPPGTYGMNMQNSGYGQLAAPVAVRPPPVTFGQGKLPERHAEVTDGHVVVCNRGAECVALTCNLYNLSTCKCCSAVFCNITPSPHPRWAGCPQPSEGGVMLPTIE